MVRSVLDGQSLNKRRRNGCLRKSSHGKDQNLHIEKRGGSDRCFVGTLRNASALPKSRYVLSEEEKRARSLAAAFAEKVR